MFKNIEIKFIINDLYSIKIIDDDFIEIIHLDVIYRGNPPCLKFMELAVRSLIKIYSKKCLSICDNLVLLILEINKIFPSYSIKEIIYELSFKNVYGYKPYKEEVEKILLFN